MCPQVICTQETKSSQRPGTCCSLLPHPRCPTVFGGISRLTCRWVNDWGSGLHGPCSLAVPCCDGQSVFSAVLTSARLSFRSPAARAVLLHRPWRTGDESCREPHSDGFPGPTQLTPGKRGLPTTPFLLQHAPTPVRTGGEGQVAGAGQSLPERRCRGDGEASSVHLACPHQRLLLE